MFFHVGILKEARDHLRKAEADIAEIQSLIDTAKTIPVNSVFAEELDAQQSLLDEKKAELQLLKELCQTTICSK